MKKITLLFVLSLVFITGLSVSPTLAATVGVRSVDGSNEIWVKPCTTFEVELYLDLRADEIDLLSNVSGGITGATIDILWDPLVALNDYINGHLYTFIDVLDKGTGGPPSMPEWVGSALEVNAFNFGGPIASSHVIETFLLHCLAPGDTEIIATGRFADPRNIALLDASFLGDRTDVNYTGLLIHQTPIPPAILLLASGLAGIVGLRRKK